MHSRSCWLICGCYQIVFLYPVRHLQSFYASLLPASPCLSPNCLYLASFLSSPPPPALSPICYLWHASSASTQFMGVICCLEKLNNSFDLSGKMFPPLWRPEWCLLASLWILKKERKKKKATVKRSEWKLCEEKWPHWHLDTQISHHKYWFLCGFAEIHAMALFSGDYKFS